MRELFHSNEIIFLSNEMVVGSECFGSFIRIKFGKLSNVKTSAC